jgi:hypothetical protein
MKKIFTLDYPTLHLHHPSNMEPHYDMGFRKKPSEDHDSSAISRSPPYKTGPTKKISLI